MPQMVAWLVMVVRWMVSDGDQVAQMVAWLMEGVVRWHEWWHGW